MQMDTSFSEERMNALALAGQTLTAMGKGPAKEKPDRSEWVVRGRTSSIFQRSKMQKADAACWEPLHIAASVNNRWMCATTQLLQEQFPLPNCFLLLTFTCGKFLIGSEGT